MGKIQRPDPRIGLTVVAQTGDGVITGKIVSINDEEAQLQCSECWFECVTLQCLYDDPIQEGIREMEENGEVPQG